MKLLFDRLSRTLEHGMNLRLQRANMISANLANAEPPGYTPVDTKFDEALQSFQAGEVPGGLHKTHAAEVTTITKDNSEGRLVFDPDHPDADGNGYVQMPNVNPVNEMVDMLTATRSYEANVSALRALKGMAGAALEIGE